MFNFKSLNNVVLRLILFTAILLSYVIYYSALFTWCKGYYTYEDLFGPLSKSFIIILSLDSFLILSLTYFLITRNDGVSKIVSLLIFILVVSSIYILPDLADSYYSQNFYDAGGHMRRGAFVTLTGHSDPSVDGYFDLQPAFFWFTAVFINIAYGVPTSPSDPVFGFLVKWFHVIASVLYIPIVYMLFRKHGLRREGGFLALSLFFIFNFGRFHYAAQTYANALFWFLLAILPDIVRNGDMKKFFIALPVLTSIVFVHEGVAVFMVITLLSSLVALLFSRWLRSALSLTFTLFTYLLLAWLLYLMYITRFTFSKFVNIFIKVINKYLTEGVIEVTSKGLWRAWQPWAYVVRFKAVYMAITILTVIALTIWMYRITRNEIYKLRAFIILGISIFLGAVAAALGGAGYIERIPKLLLPFTAITLVEATRFPKRYVVLKKTVTLLMVCLVIITPFIFFSGRNFQSISVSEDHAKEFLRTHTQTIAGIYVVDIRVRSAFAPLRTNSTFSSDTIYTLYHHDFIQTLYYVEGNITKLDSYVNELKLAYNVIYSNPTSQLIQC